LSELLWAKTGKKYGFEIMAEAPVWENEIFDIVTGSNNLWPQIAKFPFLSFFIEKKSGTFDHMVVIDCQKHVFAILTKTWNFYLEIFNFVLIFPILQTKFSTQTLRKSSFYTWLNLIYTSSTDLSVQLL